MQQLVACVQTNATLNKTSPLLRWSSAVFPSPDTRIVGQQKINKYFGMKIEDAKILLVDDDAVMRNFVVSLLGRLGAVQVQVAQDGRSGLEMTRSFRPDLIISDVHMAPVDGLDFVRGLRSQLAVELRKIPVLMLSADSSLLTLHESIPLDIVGYIIKPPNLLSLRDKIVQILNELA